MDFLKLNFEIEMKKEIKFYRERDDYGYFSNFSDHPITLENKVWPTTEHYFQAKKFEGTKYEKLVRKCSSPGDAAKTGRDRSLPLRSDWEKVKDDIMYTCVYAKFTQHLDLKKNILNTGDAKLIEHTRNDSYWGDGGDGTGKNMLGITLMKVREALRKENDLMEKEIEIK